MVWASKILIPRVFKKVDFPDALEPVSKIFLFISKELTLINEGNYDDLKLLLEQKYSSSAAIFESKDSSQKIKNPAEPKDFSKTSNKLSNNKRIALEKKLTEIESRLLEIEESLSENIDYMLINDLTEEKRILEEEYLEISSILEQ